jgi:hypothetical protein
MLESESTVMVFVMGPRRRIAVLSKFVNPCGVD